MGYRFFNVISDYRCLVNGLKKVKTDIGELKLAGEPAGQRVPAFT